MLRSSLSHLTLVPDLDAGPHLPEEDSTETLWTRLRQEAQQAVAREPMLAPLLFNSILNQLSFEAAIFHRIASRLGNDVVRPSVIADVFRRAASADPEIGCAVRADIAAVVDRDPACDRFIEPFLYFKGFHAIRRIGWRTGCGPTITGISPYTCKAARPTSFRRTSILPRPSGAAFSSTTRRVW
jgi:serine O-acetyltransferase